MFALQLNLTNPNELKPPEHETILEVASFSQLFYCDCEADFLQIKILA